MRKLFISALIVLFSSQVFAQYSGNSGGPSLDVPQINLDLLSFGLKISPNISWIGVSHNDAIADGATVKFGAGIVAKYELSSLLSVVSGVNYQLAGGYLYDSLSLNTSTTKDNYRVNYSYVEVPLGLRVQTPFVNKKSYYLQGGITTAFILSANEKVKSTLPNTKLPALDILPLTSPSAVGFFASVGMERTLYRKIKFFGEISYRNALSSFALGESYVNPSNNLYDHGYTEPIGIFPASMDFSFGIMF